MLFKVNVIETSFFLSPEKNKDKKDVQPPEMIFQLVYHSTQWLHYLNSAEN